MGLAAFNRRRNLRTAAAISVADSNPQPPAETETGTPAYPALVLINSAETPEALQPLPRVGDKLAALILKGRPEGGYPSLEALPEAVWVAPYYCKLVQFQKWGG